MRKEAGPVGNSQLHDVAFIEQALKRSMANGFTTVKLLQSYTGLHYYSAKNYMDHLCEGEQPRLRREKIGTTMHYFPLRPSK